MSLDSTAGSRHDRPEIGAPPPRSVRAVLGLLAVAVFAQAVLAGLFLDGGDAWRGWHAVNGMLVLPLLALVQVGLAVLVWRGGRGPGWLAVASAGLLVALLVQSVLGMTSQVAAHVPLGVAIFGLVGALLVRTRALTRPAPRRHDGGWPRPAPSAPAGHHRPMEGDIMSTDLVTSPTRPGRPPARRRRRPLLRLLVGALALGLVGVLALAGLAAWFWSQADIGNLGQLSFANQLKIPPLAEPRLDGAGRKVFDLRLQQGTSELLAGKPTQTWGANGAYLGPTIRATLGDQVVMQVTNRLPEPTTIHWHGMHLPAAADGGPHQLIPPGSTWSPSWRIDQPAATLWYHPHPHGATEDHVYRGVAGLFLLDDPEAGALPLPDRYGVDDIPVILQDKRFTADGVLDFGQSPFSPIGRLGDQLLVNGTHDPHLNIRHQRVRLRLLNASTARVYNLGFADDRPFELIGTDGGLLERPQPTTRVPLSPGERAEIVAAFQPGERVVLRSFPPDLGLDGFQGRFAGADDSFDLLQLRAGPRLTPSPPVPDRLVRHQRLGDAEMATTRRLELNGSSRINGLRMDLGRIDQTVTVDTTEVWEVANRSGNPHNFHVHGVQFKVSEQDGAGPPPAPAGWKDSVFIPPGGTVRLLVQLPRYSDPAMPYMFHCHLLQHEDNGMMGQFVVVQPGRPA